MPGMSFASDFEKPVQESRILECLGSMMHQEDYEQKTLLNGPNYLLACTGYKEYPLSRFESNNYVMYLEGKIYNKDDTTIDKELNVVAEWVSRPFIERKGDLKNWLLSLDGEFLLFILNKSSKSFYFLNDALGRLPVYYGKSSVEFRISREFRFFNNSIDGAKVDRMGLAQYLLFGYPLGKRTLLTGVDRLLPASVIKIDINRKQIQIAQLHTFNLEKKSDAGKTLQETTRELVRLFSEGCNNRARTSNGDIPTTNVVLALSGGLDSRTVAACLCKNSIPFVGVTRLDNLERSTSDAEIAEQLARLLKIEWKLFRVKSPRGRDLLRLLRMKNGLNYFGMSFILSFLDKVRADYGVGISYFTGDGGDKVLRDLRPCWRLKSLDALVDYIFSRNQIFDVHQVSALTRISAAEIVAELKNHVLSFPEDDLCQKYVHFLIFERAFKYLFEGEDRNRCFFWSLAPFFSIPFFRYAMECPDRLKERFALHRSVLLALSPLACSITYAYWKAPVMGRRYLVYLLIRSILDRIPGSLKNYVRGPIRRRVRDNHDACLQDQFSNSSLLREYIDEGVARAITRDCSWGGMKNLLTVASAIEELECRQTSLSNYYDAQFV
jgi:asparagine synthase (glutamine-hydrolysing)